jgi:hypothetical protein
LFDKINIRSYNIRKGVDNMEKDKYDLLIENNGFKLVSAGNFKRVYTKPYKDLGTIEVALTPQVFIDPYHCTLHTNEHRDDSFYHLPKDIDEIFRAKTYILQEICNKLSHIDKHLEEHHFIYAGGDKTTAIYEYAPRDVAEAKVILDIKNNSINIEVRKGSKGIYPNAFTLYVSDTSLFVYKMLELEEKQKEEQKNGYKWAVK